MTATGTELSLEAETPPESPLGEPPTVEEKVRAKIALEPLPIPGITLESLDEKIRMVESERALAQMNFNRAEGGLALLSAMKAELQNIMAVRGAIQQAVESGRK